MFAPPLPATWPRALALAFSIGASTVSLLAQPATSLPRYVKVPALTGVLRVTGSDGHVDLARLWAEKFRTFYPAVSLQVEGGGSGRGATALLQRETDFALLARALHEEERKLLGERLPDIVQVQAAIDVLAVFVHRDNPVRGLTFAQLECAFGAQPRSGPPARIWADLGATGALAAQPVVVLGRRSDTGVYALFKKVVLRGGDFRTEVLEQIGPASVVRGVADGGGTLGYAQLRSRSNRTRPLALGPSPDRLVEPTPEACAAGSYPLSHGIYLCVERSAAPEIQRLRLEFLRFVLSHDGQEIVQTLGLLAAPADQAAKELAVLR